MEHVVVKTKKWGNSIGVILPMSVVKSQNIKEGSEIELVIQTGHKSTVGNLMDLASKMKLNRKLFKTETIMKQIDKELWGI